MKNLLKIFFFAISTQVAWAQPTGIMISAFFQESFPFFNTNVLDFNISNLNSTPVQASIEINLTDERDKSPLLHMVRPVFSLNPGILTFTPAEFNYSYFANEKSRTLQSGKPLPSGKYQICIAVRLVSGEYQPLKECVLLNINDDFFIHLLSPGDGEEIFTLYPQLQWYTSLPDQEIVYRLLLTTLEPFRRAEDALRNNPKLLELTRQEKFFLYPADAPRLVYGKNYAWQVLAVRQNEIIGISEAWVFKPVDEGPFEKTEADCYRIITKNFNNGNYLYGDIMKFAYDNRTSEKVLNYVVIDLTTGKQIPDPPRLLLNPGFNKIDIELNKLNGIKEGNQYMIQIRNQDNEIFKLTFHAFAARRAGSRN